MRSYKTEGVIIKRKNFREADRILTVFTKHYGKIVVKAPGVRRITSRRSSHIELLNLSIFSLYQSPKSFYPIVTEAQALEDFSSIKNSLHKIGLAYYICELIDCLCAQNQENKKIFFLVKNALFQLAAVKADDVQESFSRHSDLARISLNHGDSGCAPIKSGLTRMTDSEKELSIVSDFENDLLVNLGFLPKLNYLNNKYLFIEQILERRLSSRRLLPVFLTFSDK